MFLSLGITDDHHECIAAERGNGSPEIMQFRDQQDIQSDGNCRPGQGDGRPHHIFIGELIPYAEVIINPQENIGHGK